MITKFEFEGCPAEYDDETKRLTYTKSNVSKQRLGAKLKKILRAKSKKKRTTLNLGSGFRPFSDCINLDWDKDTYPDVVRDVSEGLPFDDHKFEKVYVSHLVEHVKDVFFFMSEIWRVCKPKGRVIIIAPYCGNLEESIEPDHLRLINYGFFNRWLPDWESVQDEEKQTRGAKFIILKQDLINNAREIRFELEVVK